MPRTHTSLSPTTNVLLLFVWAVIIAACLVFVQPPLPVTLVAVGAILGAVAGMMQHLSFVQATSGFSAAASLLDVRAAFKATRWGGRYIRFLYLSKLLLIVLSFVLIRQPVYGVLFGYVASYFSLMFAREIVTLKDTFLLHRLPVFPPSPERQPL